MGKVTEVLVATAATAVAIVGSVIGGGDTSTQQALGAAAEAVQSASEKRDDNDAPVTPRGTSTSK